MTGRWRVVLAAGAAVLALVAATVLTGPPHDARTPLDPNSAAPDGLQGLVELAESMDHGVDIAIELPTDTSVRLFIPRDRLGPEGRVRVRDWVEAGGHLVVADATSPLHELETAEAPVSDLVGPSAREAGCAAPVLREVGRVSHDAWRPYRVPEDAMGCFAGGGEGAWLVARARGEGAVVALGSAAPLQNRALDRHDNAVLAAALLFPSTPGRLAILPPDPAIQAVAGGDRTPGSDDGIAELLPARLPVALLVLAVAGAALLLAIGRRFGPPVEERLPPVVPAAELAGSVGQLLQRAGRRRGAAARLRAGARRAAGRALGARTPTPELLADGLRARTGLAPDVIRLALLDLPVERDGDLVAVARATAEVHRHLATDSAADTPQ